MEDKDDVTRACHVLSNYLKEREEAAGGDILTIAVPGQVLLTWVPLLNLALGHIRERRENHFLPDDMDGPELDIVLTTQEQIITHVLTLITQAVTEGGDMFQVFDLKARMAEAGVSVGMFIEDDDGIEYIAPEETP